MCAYKNKVLVITYSMLANDGRVQRQIECLAKIENVSLVVIAQGPNIYSGSEIKYFQLPYNNSILNKIKSAWKLVSGQYDSYDHGYGANDYVLGLDLDKFDLIVANDIEPLEVVFRIATANTKILLDAHEYYPEMFSDKWKFRVFFKKYYSQLCSKYLQKIDAMLTVSEGLSNTYLANYGVKPEVVLNTPRLANLSPTNVDQEIVKLVHHGGATQSRHIEYYIELMEYLDPRFSLCLILMPIRLSYYNKIVDKVKRNDRITVVHPAKPEEIAATINKYDIGIHMLDPKNINHIYALPNKLFEFIQGRLAIAVWPGTEMSKIIEHYSCGVSSEKVTIRSMAEALNTLSATKISEMKIQSGQAALRLNSEKSQDKLDRIVRVLLSED